MRWKDEPSLILAGLSDVEMSRFHEAHVGYSGSTGRFVTDEDAEEAYPGYGRYIATGLRALPDALIAMGWTRMCVTFAAGQIIVRRERRRG